MPTPQQQQQQPNLPPPQQPYEHPAQQHPPQHHSVPPNSFAPPPGQHHPQHPGMPPMEWRPPGAEYQMPPGYPAGYPPYGMPPRHHPGYPHPAYGYPPPGAPYGYPPQMMRPPMMAPGDMVRMPPGPTPTEWAAQQQAQAASRSVPPKEGPNGNPATPSSSSQPIPSPSASSIAEESLDDKPSGTKMPAQPPPQQHPPPPQPQQIMSPMPPQAPPSQQATPSSSAASVAAPDTPKVSGKVLSKAELFEKLVGPITLHNPMKVMAERRGFFERLIEFCEHNGEPLTMVPQVSKQSIDLHRLYIGVRAKGGFQQVTKDKYWKNLCTEANPDLAESSAAGYQLRKHYQRHLLMLECRETGRNPEDEVAFADKMKRQRKREPAGGNAAAAAAVAAAQQGDQKSQHGAPGGSGAPPPGPPGAYPGNGAPGGPPGGPPQFPGHPGMDPNYHYYQQHGMMPPHPGHPGYPPQHMNAFSPGQYPGHQRPPGGPGGPPPGPQAMRAPMPQHMQEMDEHQRQWYAHQQAAAAHHHAQQQAAAQAQAAQAQQASTPAPSTTPAPQAASSSQAAPTSGANTQPATPSASNQPPTPASASASTTLHVEPASVAGGSQAGSRAPSAGPGPSATPDSSTIPSASAAADAQTTTSSETSTPGEPTSSTPSDTPAPSTSVPPPTSVQPPQPQQPPQGPPGPPGPQQHPGPYPGYPGYGPPGAMRPPAGFAPPPGAPYGYPPGAPPPAGFHPSHPQHPQHAQYLAWQQQRYHQQQQHQQQQQQGAPGGPRPPYPYPGGPVPPGPPQNRMPPPPPAQGAPSPSGAAGSNGKQPRYGTPAPPSRASAPTPQPLSSTMPVVAPSTSTQPTPTTGSYLANTLATPGPAHAPSSSMSHAHHVISQQQHQYPPGCIEATATSQNQVKRRKVYARELINATPRRLIMSLRSGLDAEAIWAINALNVLLYDDTNPHPTLQQMPGLVNVIVEHLYATLSIMYPAEFQLTEPGKPIIMDESKETVEKMMKAEKDGGIKSIIEKMPVVPRKGSDKTATFTMMSRNGLQVHFRDESIPTALRKRFSRESGEKNSDAMVDHSISSAYVEDRNSVGLGGGLAERIATRLRDKLLHEKTRPRPVFSKYLDDLETESTETIDTVEVKKEIEDEVAEEKKDVLLMRGARPDELSDCKHEVELAWPRPTALSPKSQAMEELAHRALALSNILRGFSFVAGSDVLMARNEALLFIIGRLLKLNVKEHKISSKRPGIVMSAEELKTAPKQLSADEKRAKEKSVLDEVDATTAQMVETANQLRDDAFVMLTHMSVSLNLVDLPDAIAYPIYDGLLRWSVSRVPEATDSSIPCPVSPRDYSLEIMCKMVVIERNVDMFLSTGSWSRVEQFVHILTRLLTMNEETHYREFAIVILNALCIASEAVCYICAMETSAIAHLILFIDSADQNMHQVMQAHGMAALRDNPELMGTSVGMLRRAASMLRLLVKVPKAYKIYMKHQTRLLQFTMSQLMDSRVAGMIADTLYEIQEFVKEFGEDVPEPLKITYSEGYQPSQTDDKESTSTNSDAAAPPQKSTSSSPKPVEESAATTSVNVHGNGTLECETSSRPLSSEAAAAVITPYENHHKNEEEEDLKKEIDEGESCDGYDTEAIRLSQKRSAAALIDEQSRSPPPAKRAHLSNGFDKSKSSVSTNGTLGDASQNDGALTTAVA
ncbi:ARID domain-containing protein [Caenorhabditis elegans]|nr:ARID domain-containing protein [Caenorhabditis elegans]CCD62467.1 ARID domain-containing protein [Caenorhabditis elegans]|eukprot:NP_491562.3 Uncharacterized protein CELE_C01G8.9 [Caenorhabditis elegans]